LFFLMQACQNAFGQFYSYGDPWNSSKQPMKRGQRLLFVNRNGRLEKTIKWVVKLLSKTAFAILYFMLLAYCCDISRRCSVCEICALFGSTCLCKRWFPSLKR
jgi:hypothetical protein